VSPDETEEQICKKPRLFDKGGMAGIGNNYKIAVRYGICDFLREGKGFEDIQFAAGDKSGADDRAEFVGHPDVFLKCPIKGNLSGEVVRGYFLEFECPFL
jgi:hypothetical protein